MRDRSSTGRSDLSHGIRRRRRWFERRSGDVVSSSSATINGIDYQRRHRKRQYHYHDPDEQIDQALDKLNERRDRRLDRATRLPARDHDWLVIVAGRQRYINRGKRRRLVV